jgi:hypothetical protein
LIATAHEDGSWGSYNAEMATSGVCVGVPDFLSNSFFPAIAAVE